MEEEQRGSEEEVVAGGVRVGEGNRRTCVRLRERSRSPSVRLLDGPEPRLSLECERLAGGLLRGEPDREPGPEPGLEPPDPPGREEPRGTLRELPVPSRCLDPETPFRICFVPLVSPDGVWLSLVP